MSQGITAILNPAAGQGTAGRIFPIIRHKVNHIGQVHWQQTRRPGDGTRLAYEATLAGTELIIAAGGDGTVNEVVNGLMKANRNGKSNPVVAILPLGSANDFATGLNIRTLSDGLERLSAGQVHQIDVGCIQSRTGPTRYFCFSGGVGFLATVAFKRYRIHHIKGRWLYFLALLASIRQIRQPINMKIVFDQGEEIEQSVLLISVNNTPTVGGFLLTPAAKLDDGAFDVLLSEGSSLTRLPRVIIEISRGRHLDFPEFQLRRSQRLSIKALKPVPVHLDGQIYCSRADRIRQLEISLIPQGLQVLA